jgi:hypothetical protein
MAQLALINRLHMDYFATLLARLSQTREGAGSLLDSTTVLRGSAFGDSNEHDHMDLPIVLAGGSVRGGQHVMVARGTPMSNLLLATLQDLGVPARSFGDSTGALPGVFHA